MAKKKLTESRAYLFVTEFLVGVCLMGVEIAANRLFTPYISGSQVVLTIITGVVMIAMAVGNFLGGRLADKRNSPKLLYCLLACAGVYVIFDAFLGRYLIAVVAALFGLFVNGGLIVWTAILSALLLLFPPILCLGMVTPTLIKFALGEGKSSGKLIGLVESLNTAGSILGTFLPTFLTIPFIGTPWSFALFGSILVLLGLIYVIASWVEKRKEASPNPPSPTKEEAAGQSEKKDNPSPVAEAIAPKKKHPHRALAWEIALVSLAAPLMVVGDVLDAKSEFVFWDDKSLVFQGESMYNYLQVSQDEEAYYFSTSVLFSVQSTAKKDGSLTGMYYDQCLLAPYLSSPKKEEPLKVLVLGNGTGTYASLLKKQEHFPYPSEITGVEIDQKIIDLGKKYFATPEDVEVVCDDGRSYLTNSHASYDVIMVDAYSSISAPFQMTTVEFFQSVFSHLKDEGTMVMNINMTSSAKNSVDKALCDTLYSSFPEVYAYKMPSATGLEVFARKKKGIREKMEEALPLIEESSLKSIAEDVIADGYVHSDGGIRLKDSSADVEVRSMNAVDGIILRELSEYRRIYRERGLRGLLEYFFS